MQWSIKKKALLGSILLIAALLFIFAVQTYRASDFRLLYANLAPEDYIALSDWLTLRDIEFKDDNNHQSIYISADRIHQTRLEMAQYKLPGNLEQSKNLINNHPFAVIDAVTSSDPSIALQLELSKTISVLEHIQAARVHLSPASTHRSIDNEPSATVVLTLAPGRTLTSSQLQGILHLLSASVAGLEPDRISLFDNSGNLISRDDTNGASHLFRDGTLTYQASVERSLEKKAQDLVDAMIGKGQAMIRVAAELDFARNETTSERYDPEEPVVRSEHIQQEPTDDSRPNASSTLEDSPDAGPASRYRPSVTTSSRFDYEISKTVSKTIQPVGGIEQLSVTVLVVDEKSIESDGTINFQPRSDEKLGSIRSLVTAALSLKPDRGDSIHLMRIPRHGPPDDFTPKEVSPLYDMLNFFPVGSITLIVFIFLLFYFLILKPVIGLLKSEMDQFASELERQKQEAGSDTQPLAKQEDIALALKNEIENNPVAAAHVIKRWIQET